MSIERISTIQTASVITQPSDATEPLTLIEKLEQKRDAWFKRHKEYCDMEARSRGCAIDECIDIVKQHQAESGWISVDERLPTENDGRVSWGVNAYKKYILVNIVSRGIAMTCRFNLTDKCFETADNVTSWAPLPQPPSEVQDD